MDDTQQLHRIIDKISDIKVLVIGDVMLDMYEHCVVKRISPEAPVPIATVINDSCFLGGAGNVANNARALGAEVSLVSVVGSDTEGTIVRELLQECGIDHQGLITEAGRVTTQKKRVISGTQQLLRIDRETTEDVSDVTKETIVELLADKIRACDVIIISDYCKGLLTDDMVASIKNLSVQYDKKVFVDSKNKQFLKYSNFYLVKPNKEEAEHFTGEKFLNTYENLEAMGKKLREVFQSNIVITLGGDGIVLFEEGQFVHKKTYAREVFDVSGAGDTVLATVAAVVATGASLADAVHLSNHAAGHVVSRLGTTVCDHSTLRKILEG
jgi:rfaE bifunctional protein kinase chain/domain